MNNDYTIVRKSEYVQMSFPASKRCLANSPLGGGFMTADNYLNLKVPYNLSKKEIQFPTPSQTLREFSRSLGLNPDNTVGMMTAADLETFAYARVEHEEFWIDSGITVGLGNARRAGDDADYDEFPQKSLLPNGTINIAVVSNISFSDAAMVEAVILSSEAKAAILAKHSITSTKSGEGATGTGTDAVAVFTDIEGVRINYCGKHVLAGQMLARAVMSALSEAIQQYYKILATKHWMR